MRPTRPIIALAVALGAVACGDQSPTRPASVPPGALFAKPAAGPTLTWKIPLADAGLSVRSDQRFSDGTYSVYRHGECSADNPIFLGGSGDAKFTFTYGQTGGKGPCGRTWTVLFSDGVAETLAYQGGVQVLQNATFSIAVGDSALRHFRIGADRVPRKNPVEARCGEGLVFGEGGVNPAIGSDSVWVKRVDASTWHVHSQAAPENKAFCVNNGQLYEMNVDFVVESSQPLP